MPTFCWLIAPTNTYDDLYFDFVSHWILLLKTDEGRLWNRKVNGNMFSFWNNYTHCLLLFARNRDKFMTICIPQFQRKKEDRRSTASEQGFYEAMSDRTSLDTLKSITIQEFCSENLLFWLKYYGLMKMCYLEIMELIEISPEKSYFHIELAKSLGVSLDCVKAELLLDYSKNLALVLLRNGLPGSFSCRLDDCKDSIFMTYSIWKEFLDVYGNFLMSGSSLELNTPENIFLKVKQAMEESTQKGGKLSLSNSADIIKEIRKQTGVEFVISIQLLDEIKNEVLKLLFFNTYSHMLHNMKNY
jgi:hypothetical protein